MAESAGSVTMVTTDGGAGRRHSDIAYDELLARILDLRLAPGALVNEQMLARSLGLGRMPVREALARLAYDQFIVVLPRRGTIIAPLDLNVVVHIFDAREAIECGIAHVAARKVTAEHLVALRSLISVAGEAAAAGDTQGFLTHDTEVHSYLVDLLDNPLVHDATERLLLHNVRFWRSFFEARPDVPVMMLSYEPLLAALEARDGDRAAAAMRQHLATARQALQSAL